MLSIHDNDVYAFSCDCVKRRIILHTSYDARGVRELTDIIFSDVLAHSFEHVLQRNILFDVREVASDTIIDEHRETFDESWTYGWPIANVEYRGNLEYLKTWLHEQSFRAFTIDSSLGLSGWVLAKKYDFVIRDTPFPIGG
ncbi:MAG TPA: hypothetical protein VH107_13680 [Lacipirellulaceae bacterium]|nr:hypothetical protein [Lacipirellulaceae bacterium]